TIMARSTEIGVMKLVGATNGFIRWPFFIEGFLHGVVGALIQIGLLSVGCYYCLNNFSGQPTFNFIVLLPFNPFIWQLMIIIVDFGAVIGMWGSVMSIRKFLKV